MSEPHTPDRDDAIAERIERMRLEDRAERDASLAREQQAIDQAAAALAESPPAAPSDRDRGEHVD